MSSSLTSAGFSTHPKEKDKAACKAEWYPSHCFRWTSLFHGAAILSTSSRASDQVSKFFRAHSM